MTDGHTPDLIERLRDRSTWRDAFHRCIIQPEMLTEAADEIATLRDRVADFCEAMEYAAGCDDGVDEDTAASEIMSWAGSPMAVAYTNARSILSRAQQGGGDAAKD